MQLQHHKEKPQFQHSMSEQDWRSVFGYFQGFPHHEANEGDFVELAKVWVLEVAEAFFVLPWDDHDYVFAYAFPTKLGDLCKPQYLEL